jgi:hypothetical protein
VATVSGGADADASNNVSSRQTYILSAPLNVVATATSATQVNLTWNDVPHASYYQILRYTSGGTLAYTDYAYTNAYVSVSLTAGTSYLYQVRAINGNFGPASSNELATTILFTDPTITPGVTPLRKVHMTELRTAVNAVRALAALPAATFTDPDLTGVAPKPVHFTELRTALNAARAALALPAIDYTDPVLTSGIRIKAAHLIDLRQGVK